MKLGFDEHGQVTAIIGASFILVTAIIAYTSIILKDMG